MKHLKLLAYLGLFAITSACNVQPNLTPLDATPIATPPQLVSIKLQGYTPAAGRLFKQFFVINNSVKPKNGILYPSTARDGMTDVLKTAHSTDFGFDLSGPYSANTYFSDLFMYLAGIQYAQQNLLYCASTLTLSTTSDGIIYTDHRDGMQKFVGLRDCEKAYIGLDYNKFDYDGDGVPDYLELRCGLNPKNASDAALSVTGDGVSNLEKCKRNIPLDENADSQPNKLFAYNYDVKLQPDGSTTINVTNIPVLNGGLDNFFTFYLVELDTASLTSYLYTAYATLGANSNGREFILNYWVTGPSTSTNQEIIFP